MVPRLPPGAGSLVERFTPCQPAKMLVAAVLGKHDGGHSGVVGMIGRLHPG